METIGNDRKRPGHGIVTRSDENGDTESTTMKLNSLSLPLLLLAFATSAWAQNVPPQEHSAPARPLNLSLPRDVMRTAPPSFGGEVGDMATRNLRPEPVERKHGMERLPYGAGYEARQGEGGATAATGRGGGHAGSSSGQGGRGGMGRRR